VKRYS